MIEKRILDNYLSGIDIIGEGLPVWFNARRSDAAASLHLHGLPSPKDERYLHSDIVRLLDGEREQYFVPRRCDAPAPLLPDADPHRIVLVNGRSDDGLNLTDEGLVYGSLRAAACSERFGAVVERWLDSAADISDTPTALTRMFVQDGAFVYLPEGADIQSPVLIDDFYRADGEAQLCFAQTLVVAERGARAEIIVAHRSEGEGRLTACHTREVVAGEKSEIDFSELYDLAAATAIVSSAYVRQEEGSRCGMMLCKTGDGYVRASMRSDLAAAGASNDLWALYLCGGEEHCDLNTVVRHEAPDCRSYSLVKGAASGSAVGSFAGMVYVAPDAQHTDAQQQSRNLLLSPQARIFTQPQLEIYADDVKCSHGATVGQLDDDAVYYMRQRGLGEQQARRLQLEGFAFDVVRHCGYGDLCRYIGERTAAKLERM